MDISKILGLCLTLMVAVEEAIPQSGMGETKQQIVLNGVNVALSAAGAGASALGHTDVQTVTKIATSFIGSTVAILNNSGVWRKANPTGQVAAPSASGVLTGATS